MDHTLARQWRWAVTALFWSFLHGSQPLDSHNGDVFVFRACVVSLGVVAITAAVIAGVLSYNKDEIPPFIAGLGTAAVAVLGTLATQSIPHANREAARHDPGRPPGAGGQ